MWKPLSGGTRGGPREMDETLPMQTQEVEQAVADAQAAESPAPAPSPGLTADQQREQYHLACGKQPNPPGHDRPLAGEGASEAPAPEPEHHDIVGNQLCVGRGCLPKPPVMDGNVVKCAL